MQGVRFALFSLPKLNHFPFLQISKNASLLKKTSNFDQNIRKIATSASKHRKEDRRELIQSTPIRDQGVEGEKSLDLDSNQPSRESMFPDENTPNLLFDGVRFCELPVCHIKASKNNTIMTLTDFRGRPKLTNTCGTEGFKNTKKGTNIAAQATGISMGRKSLAKGVVNIRIKIQGLGPGRMTSVRGLQMSGMNIVSLTDDTPIPGSRFPRPRKQRKL